MPTTDPLAVIAEEPPRFLDDEAIHIARDHWGLDVSVKSLVSERDQNFRMKTHDGRQFVLKIANAAESSAVTDFQVQGLIYIADRVQTLALPVSTPQVLPTVDGATSIELSRSGATHVARVVSFLQGAPLGDGVATPKLARNMGACLAHLGHALAGFSHPGSEQSLLWDLQKALDLRKLVSYITDEGVAAQVTDALDDFETHAAAGLPSMRSQVVHSDLNPDNVLIDPDDPDVVAGVIDFGDMLRAPLIVDVAIACSYLRVADGNPLELIAEFVAGYHGVEPLITEEIDILFELIQARLCASISILDWRAAMRGPGDPYLEKVAEGEASAGNFLARLREIPREHAQRMFRQVCASAG